MSLMDNLFDKLFESTAMHFDSFLEIFNSLDMDLAAYTDYIIANFMYIIPTVLTFLLLLKVLLVKILSRKKQYAIAASSSLGKRSLQEITKLKDLVLEIHYAACYCGDNSDMVRRCKLLLHHYPAACDIPMSGHGHNYTPFLRACRNGCSELMAFMIRLGANLSAVTDGGEGAIYLATYWLVKKKCDDFLPLTVLILAGADINHARNDGLTALDLAALSGHSRLAQWLVSKGASATPQEDLSMIMEWRKKC